MISDLGANGGKTVENTAATANSETGQSLEACGVVATGATASPSSSFVSVPHGTFGTHQPITDVAAYRRQRRPVATIDREPALFITLPVEVRNETEWYERAMLNVQRLVNTGLKVQPACVETLEIFRRRAHQFQWKIKTFRALYDRWATEKDWTVLVNKSKAPGTWRAFRQSLPDRFLEFCAMRFTQFARRDGKQQALESIKRQWRTGRNPRGDDEVIPGYEEGWTTRDRELFPIGWHNSNIRRQIKARNKFDRATQAAAHEGIAAARKFTPQVRSDRTALRFLEVVQFDDVKLDWRVFDPATGQVMDLWLLIAHDLSSTVLLGFGIRPARVREDGTQEHLKLRDMKQLAGWLLERYGLPPYPVAWKVEHGTATFSDGSRAALEEMLAGRITLSFSQMIGGKSSAGYAERGIGNSRGKASLESSNRLLHTIGCFTEGQTGPRYDVRPADLIARENECRDIWNSVPQDLRFDAQYPLQTLIQARRRVVEICRIRNSRTNHAIQGFEKIVVQHGDRLIQRPESPEERAGRLMKPFLGQWTRISPDVITAFYEHTQRNVIVNDRGEIEFTHEREKLTFAGPHAAPILTPGTRALAYYHPDDPRYLHLTSGKGAVLGTWLRRSLVAAGDDEALAEAIRYSMGMVRAAKEHAAHLNAGERARLEAMREHNASLMRFDTFESITEPAPAGPEAITSPIAAALTAAGDQRSETRESSRRHAQAVADKILASQEREDRGETAAGDNLLSILAGPDPQP